MSASEMVHVLDNPIWNMFNSRPVAGVNGTSLAKCIPPELGGVAALANVSKAAIRDLEALVPVGGTIMMIAREQPELPGWTVLHDSVLVQMVGDQFIPEPSSALQTTLLTEADLPDIDEIVDLSNMGPFFPFTLLLGKYIGIRQQGKLIAMAGLRLHLPGYREISTVCTHPDQRGKGHASLLVGLLANEIWGSGEKPFLHVNIQNVHAQRLYEKLHFYKRANMQIRVVKRGA